MIVSMRRLARCVQKHVYTNLSCVLHEEEEKAPLSGLVTQISRPW